MFLSRTNAINMAKWGLNLIQHAPDDSVILRLGLVRWRKRRWAPLNASKYYYVPERTPIVPEEYEELKRRTANYRTATRAIRAMLVSERRSKQAQASDHSLVEEEDRIFAELLEGNKRWNEESTKLRNIRVEKEQQEKEVLDLKRLLDLEEEERQAKERACSLVEKEIVETQHLITNENLEEEIEKALNTRSNYNFSIDLDGNRYFEMPDGTTALETKESPKAEENLDKSTQSI